MHLAIGADDVVVGHQVVDAELLDPERVRPYRPDVAAQLGLRVDDADSQWDVSTGVSHVATLVPPVMSPAR